MSDRIYEEERFLLYVQEAIAEAVAAMGRGGRTRVAKRLGVSRPWVSRFLAGGKNATLTKAASFAWAAGVRLEVKAVKLP